MFKCLNVVNPYVRDQGGMVSRMMTASMNGSNTAKSEKEFDDQLSATMPRLNVYSARLEKDPSTDTSLLDHLDQYQNEEINSEIGKRKKEARDNGLSSHSASRKDRK